MPSNYTQDRDYQLFAVLAGVRNYDGVTPIAEPRGLPPDFAMEDAFHPLTSLEHMDPRRRRHYSVGDPLRIDMGDHSFSWLTGDEMLGWFDGAPTADLAYFFDEVRRLASEHGEVRFVFGFDS